MVHHQEKVLTRTQRIGIRDYNLTEEQVNTPNFNEYTLVAIHNIAKFHLITDKQVAFEMVRGLDFHQSRGVAEFYLTRDDVQTQNFGRHTIDALAEFRRRRRVAGPRLDKAAFLYLKELNEVQTRGVLEYDLFRTQVQTPNFGEHTLRIMHALIIREERENDRDLDTQTAFEMVSGLDEYQVQGVWDYGLVKNQVQSHNFGWHTLAAIAYLKANFGLDNQAAFKEVEGLNKAQIRGVFYFELTKDQVVETENFGEHTLKAIRILTAKTPNPLTKQEAFERVKGLDEAQAEGTSEYLLTREQVEDKFYSEKVLETMKYLHRQIPDAEVEVAYLYEFAINLPDYQARGILECGLTLEQVGIGISQDKFIIEEPKDPNFSASTVDAIEFLCAKNAEMTLQEAYDIAIKLNSDQIRGMIDYGLTEEQVNTQLFIDSGEVILQELIEALRKPIEDEEMDLDFPLSLSDKQQEIVSAGFNEIVDNQETIDDAFVANLANVPISAQVNNAHSSAIDLNALSRTQNSHTPESMGDQSERDNKKYLTMSKKQNKKGGFKY